MAREHSKNLDDSQNECQENLNNSVSDDMLNKSTARTQKPKEPARIIRQRITFCPNRSSSSFNRSESKNAMFRQYRKINAQLAQTCNHVKGELNQVKRELLVVKGEKLTLQTQNARLRGHVDPQVDEKEVQQRFLELVGPVKDCLNAALDNMVGLSDNLTQALRLTTAPSRMSCSSRQSSSSVELSRIASIGNSFSSTSVFPMRNVTNFPPPSSPTKDLPKSLVSPVVAGLTVNTSRASRQEEPSEKEVAEEDLGDDRTTDQSEVGGFIPEGNILEADLERNEVEVTRLESIDMDETEALGLVVEVGGEDKENTSGEAKSTDNQQKLLCSSTDVEQESLLEETFRRPRARGRNMMAVNYAELDDSLTPELAKGKSRNNLGKKANTNVDERKISQEIPNSKESKKPPKQVTINEEAKSGSEEVKDEGRSRRRAAGSFSYKEPSMNKKLRQGDQHSVVPQMERKKI